MDNEYMASKEQCEGCGQVVYAIDLDNKFGSWLCDECRYKIKKNEPNNLKSSIDPKWEELRKYIKDKLDADRSEADIIQFKNGDITRHNYLIGRIIAMTLVLDKMDYLERLSHIRKNCE